jgi:hypothetical protein
VLAGCARENGWEGLISGPFTTFEYIKIIIIVVLFSCGIFY